MPAHGPRDENATAQPTLVKCDVSLGILPLTGRWGSSDRCAAPSVCAAFFSTMGITVSPALLALHAHCPCALREVWVVTVRPSSFLSSDRSPAVCRSSVECTAAFCDCTTRQQDISSPFSPACMALLPLPAPCLVSVSVFVQLHHCCCLTGPVAVRSLFCAHVFSLPHLQVPPPRHTPR